LEYDEVAVIVDNSALGAFEIVLLL